MPKRQKKNSFKPSQVSRVHPDDLPTKHHHHHTREQTMFEHSKMQAVNAADEYELGTVARMDDDLSLSSVLSMRAESPPIEVIQVSPPVKNISQLTLYRPDVSNAFVPLQSSIMTQPSIRSFVVSPTSHLLKEVSFLPTRTVPLKDESKRQWISSRGKQWMSLESTKPINAPCLSVVVAISIAVCLIIILAALLSAKRQEQATSSNSFLSSACGTNCMMLLTSFPASTIASWPFDDNLFDLNNIYTGTYTNPPTIRYREGNVGNAISFHEAQYVFSMTQFMNLSYQSWTIEAWLLLEGSISSHGIFGQCESSTTTDKCLSLSIKSNRLHLDFNNDGVGGKTFLSSIAYKWRHVAFVYDYTTMRQSIYLDGALEATTGTSGVAAGPYKGSLGSITIGWTSAAGFFTGRIDILKVSSGAKTACQILNDATLTAYYPFDASTTYLDVGYNSIHGVWNLLTNVPGRINEAFAFQNEYSYFQSFAFTAFDSSEPFSVSLWIHPFVVTGGTLVRIATGIRGDGESCFDMLGFSSTGQIAAGLFNSWATCCPPPDATVCPCKGTASITGSTVSVNTWSHIVLTYTSSNGMALYMNGVLQGVTGSFGSFPHTPDDYRARNFRPYMTVGNSRTSGSTPGCLGGNDISPGSYQGLIDDFRVYSREITKTEICSLYHV